jgi:hypothetical protein
LLKKIAAQAFFILESQYSTGTMDEDFFFRVVIGDLLMFSIYYKSGRCDGKKASNDFCKDSELLLFW